MRSTDLRSSSLKSRAFSAIREILADCKLASTRSFNQVTMPKIRHIFTQWRLLTNKNLAKRRHEMGVKKMIDGSRVQRLFIEWKELAMDCMQGKNLRGRVVRVMVFRAFKKFVELKHRKKLVTAACTAHLEQFRVRLIFFMIRTSAIRQKQYRDFQLKIYYRMDLLRQR